MLIPVHTWQVLKKKRPNQNNHSNHRRHMNRTEPVRMPSMLPLLLFLLVYALPAWAHWLPHCTGCAITPSHYQSILFHWMINDRLMDRSAQPPRVQFWCSTKTAHLSELGRTDSVRCASAEAYSGLDCSRCICAIVKHRHSLHRWEINNSPWQSDALVYSHISPQHCTIVSF